ncbi:unnamed protein product [[Candida] boidinii]|nr:unnamed protein product [[Candida] boidinii]
MWRTIWFNIRIFDTFLSKSLGFPPFINEKYSDCKLPQGDTPIKIAEFDLKLREICRALCAGIKPLTLLEYLKEISKLFELFNSDGNTCILALLKPREGVTKSEAEKIVSRLFLVLESIHLLTISALHLRVAIKNIETLKNDGNKIDEHALKLLKRISVVFVEISNLGAILTFLIFKNFLNGNTIFKNFPVLNKFLISNSSRGLFSANMTLFIHLIEEFSDNNSKEKILIKKSNGGNNEMHNNSSNNYNSSNNNNNSNNNNHNNNNNNNNNNNIKTINTNNSNTNSNSPDSSKSTTTHTPTMTTTSAPGIAISPANVSVNN